MKKKLQTKRAISFVLGIAMVMSAVLGYIPAMPGAEVEAAGTYTAIGQVKDASVSKNVVDLTTEKEKIKITFLEDGIFRLNMEMKDNKFLDKPVPRDPEHKGEILDKQLDEYTGGGVNVDLDKKDAKDYIINR